MNKRPRSILTVMKALCTPPLLFRDALANTVRDALANTMRWKTPLAKSCFIAYYMVALSAKFLSPLVFQYILYYTPLGNCARTFAILVTRQLLVHLRRIENQSFEKFVQSNIQGIKPHVSRHFFALF